MKFNKHLLTGLIIMFLPFLSMAQSSPAEKIEIEQKLADLKWSLFNPFQQFLLGDKLRPESYREEIRRWYGELVLSGANLYQINGVRPGYFVYDINKKEYGHVSYDKFCDDYFHILDKYLGDGILFFKCGSSFYKTILDDEDYSDFKYYNYPTFKNDTWTALKPVFIKEINDFSAYEFENSGKIYTYNVLNNNRGDYDYNKDLDIISAKEVVGIHNNLNYLLVESNNESKIINISNIIENYNFPQKIQLGYGTVDIKQGHTWNLESINYFSKNKILITLNVIESYKRYLPNEIHGLAIDVKRDLQLGVLLNADLTLNRAKVISSSDETAFSENNEQIYKLSQDGARVACYNSNLDLEWFKQFGIINEKTGDFVQYIKEQNGILYLIGTTKNKYHIGKADPIVWKINPKNGEVISETILKYKNPPNLEGFLFNQTALYLVLSEDEGDAILVNVDSIIN